MHVKWTTFHPDLSTQEKCQHTQAHPRGGPTTINTIAACNKGIVPPHCSPSRDVPLASTNNPAILDHLQCPICLHVRPVMEILVLRKFWSQTVRKIGPGGPKLPRNFGPGKETLVRVGLLDLRAHTRILCSLKNIQRHGRQYHRRRHTYQRRLRQTYRDVMMS